jgi:hypothetical protein
MVDDAERARDRRVVQGGGNDGAVVHEAGAGGKEIVGDEYGDVGGGSVRRVKTSAPESG